VLWRQIETSINDSTLLSTIAQQREALAREHATVQGQRNQLEALIDASDAAIMMVGRDRKIAYANAEMARLVGIPREAVLGASVETVHRFLGGSFVDATALASQETVLSLDASLRDRVELTFPRRAVYQRVVAPVRESGGSLLGHTLLYRAVTHEMEFQLGPVPVADGVAAGVETVAAFAQEQGVTVATEPPAEPQVVLGVRDRLVQVIVNLVSNAIKFSPRGGRVTVRWWSENGFAVTEVADQGAGIPADQLQAVFEPFRQLDSSTTREHGGAGLGLAISQGIVDALGGKLWAESVLGAGSRFFVRLPLAPEQPARSPAR